MRLVKVNDHWTEKTQPASTAVTTTEAGEDHVELPDMEIPLSELIAQLSQPPPPSSVPPPSIPPPPLQVDFSPMFSYFDSQFAILNQTITSVMTDFSSFKQEVNQKLDTIVSNVTAFQQAVLFKFTETQDMLDKVEGSAASSRTRFATSFQELFDFVKFQTTSLANSVNSAGVTLQDIRDNSDRVCLEHNIPSLQALLDERFADLRAEFQNSQTAPQPFPSQPPSFTSPPPHARHSFSKQFQRKQAKKSKVSNDSTPCDPNSKDSDSPSEPL